MWRTAFDCHCADETMRAHSRRGCARCRAARAAAKRTRVVPLSTRVTFVCEDALQFVTRATVMVHAWSFWRARRNKMDTHRKNDRACPFRCASRLTPHASRLTPHASPLTPFFLLLPIA